MGKVRSKKCASIARVDPTGLEKAGGDEEECVAAELGPVPNFVQTILEQLQSHLTEERDSGLNSLSVASSKPPYLEEVLKSDIFKIVGPLLLDRSVSVRHSAAGCLRNFSSVNMDVCEEMIRADVLTPLVALIKQKYCGEDWLPMSKEKKSKQPFKIDSATEAFVEAVTLLSNLCEAGETAVKIFNREGLGNLLCKFLTVQDYGIRVAVCSALCLYSATEDNPDAVSNRSLLEEILMKILLLSNAAGDLDLYQLAYLQTTAIGILVNLHQGDLRKVPPASVAVVMKIINSSLELDHASELMKFSSEIPLSNGKHKEVYHREAESDMRNIFEMDEKCERIKALVNSQIMSLQILSNILSSEDDQWDEDDSSVESVEEFDDSVEMANTEEEDVEMTDIRSEMPLEVYESLSNMGTIAKVLTKIKILPVNVAQILNEDESRGRQLLKKCSILRSTALLCLQNLVEILTIPDLEKVIGIGDLWTGLGSALTECEPSDETMIEAVTSAMRAIIQSIVNQKGGVHPASDKLCSGIPIFHRVYEAVSIDKVKVNVIRIIGCIGILLTRLSKDVQVEGLTIESLLATIAENFLQILSSLKVEREGLWVAAEIFDTLLDVFAEDDYNHVNKQTGLIAKLRIVQPTFKRQVRSERRSLGENGAVIQTANTNLPRFIQYKEKHGAC